MSQERNEGNPQQYKIEDMSETTGRPAAPPSTRGRVSSENPAVKSPMSEEQYRASQESARRAALEAEERMRQAYQEAPPEPQHHVEEQHVPQHTPQHAPQQSPARLQSDLRQLALTGRVEEEVEIGGFVFSMRTLTGKENNEAAKALGMGNEIENMGSLRHAILARSIQTINGVVLEALYQGPDKDKLPVLQQREAVVGDWQNALITELMLKYDSMLERSTKTFVSQTKEDLKN